MKFIKEDYQLAQRKKWRRIIIFFIALIGIIVIWHSYQVRSAADKDFAKMFPPRPDDTALSASYAGRNDDSEKTIKEERQPMDLPTLVYVVKSAIVVIYTYDQKNNPIGQGTGFFINKHGHAISNQHVFRGSYRAEVKLQSGTFPVLKVLAEDVDSDLILFSVRIAPGDYRHLPFAYDSPPVGERIVVIGNPLGLEATVSDGIVSALRDLEPFGRVLQVTSPISPGSSGSPVMNMKAEVVGIATFQLRQGQNLNFAIPSSRAKNLVSTGEKSLADLSFASKDELAAAQGPFSKGMVYYNSGDFENAVMQFKEAVKENPRDAAAYFYLGMSYREIQAFKAIEAFKTAVSIDSGHAEAFCHLGATYNRLGMFKEAAQSLREALRINPDYTEALLQIGIAYISDKEYRASAKVLQRAAELDPNTKAYYYLGIAYLASRMYDEALDAFQDSVNQDPDFPEAYIGLGYCYAAFRNWKQGINTLKHADSLAPGQPEIHFLLGMMYLGDDDLESAEHEASELSGIGNKWIGKKIAIYDERKLSEMLSELRMAISSYRYQRLRRR
ncbi:MAG: tetratricopeptide repeat protein [Candidatus Aminicenantes bacterium]|nr:tetratricopeptide repeat protein [Candidatus Aminicenantes bacterium]